MLSAVWYPEKQLSLEISFLFLPAIPTHFLSYSQVLFPNSGTKFLPVLSAPYYNATFQKKRHFHIFLRIFKELHNEASYHTKNIPDTAFSASGMFFDYAWTASLSLCTGSDCSKNSFLEKKLYTVTVIVARIFAFI